jgi:hypothetical protein
MAAEIKTILNIIKMADYKAQHAAEKSKVKKYFFFLYKLGAPRIPSIAQCIARRWRYTVFTSERLCVQANKNRQKITEGKLGLPPALVRASRGDPVSPFDETCPAWLNLLAASRRPPV